MSRNGSRALCAALAAALLSHSAFSRTALSRTPLIPLNLIEGEDIRFTQLSTPEGLSQNRVEHILQDDQGFMWFGTEDGLNRYDGYSFKVFRHDNTPTSLSGVTVTALFKDRAGTLWVGVGQFLDRFDPATETFTHYRPDADAGVIFSIFQDNAGGLWLATKHGLSRMDPVTGKFSYYRHDPRDPSTLASDDLRFVMQDRAGTLWLVSAAGLDTLDPRTNKISHHNQLMQTEDAFWPDTRLYEDRSGLLWMFSTSADGFGTIDRTTGNVTRYSFHKTEQPALIESGLLSVLEDRDGVFWLATGGNGIVRFDRKTNSLEQFRNKPGVPGSLSSNFIFSLFEDREGTIWAGTGGGGVSHFQRKLLPFRVFQHDPANPNSLDQNYVLSAYEDSQGILWIGNDKVLNSLDRATGRYTFYRHDPADPGSISQASVTSAVEDSDRFLWFGTYGGGLNRFDRRTRRFKSWRAGASPDSLSSDLIFSLFLDRNRILWIGTEDGLNRFDLRTEHVTGFRQSTPSPTSRIVQDSQGLLWLGTVGGGLSSFDPQSGRFTAYRHSDSNRMSLSDDHVNSLLISGSGNLWVGTQNGLDKFDLRTRAFTGAYGKKDGLADDAVEGIEEDRRSCLWISTNTGLSRFQPASGRFTSFYGSEGLAGDDFSVLFPVSFKSSSGEMFFGGVSGVTSFYPDKVDEVGNSYVPPVVLTELRINNIPVSVGGNSPLQKAITQERKITVTNKESIFSLEFSALSYLNPAGNRYRYRLEGLENAWYKTDSERRFASYSTLPPGDYVFHVQGSNNDGVWNENGVSLNIHVSPPWWGAFWFKMFFCFLLLLCAWAGYKYRLHEISRQLNLRADERVAERTRIAQELHDTLLQGFLSASMQVHVAADCLPEDSSARPILTRALELMRQVIDEGRNAVRGLRSSDSGSLGLEQAFSRIQQELIAGERPAGEVDFRVIVDGERRPLHPVLRDEVYRIGREALINAFRHAHAKKIEMELRYSARRFSILVRDDGLGIDPAVLREGRDGHWGLSGMRERADRIGARLQVMTRASAGTEIELSVPANIAFQNVPGSKPRLFGAATQKISGQNGNGK